MARVKDTVTKEKEIIRLVVDSYEDLKKSIPSSWAVFSNDMSEVEIYLREVCHADMGIEDKDKFDQMITAVPCNKPRDLAYITFLIEYPFKSFKDRISLEAAVDGENLRYYLRLTKLDTWPANVLFNFCIASRVTIEYPQFIKYWGKAVDAGVHPGLAFCAVSRMAWSDENYPYKTVDIPGDNPWDWQLADLSVPPGHFWFDLTANWKRIINGEPVVTKFTQPYKAKPGGVKPCNVIWGREGAANSKKLVGKTMAELSIHFGLTTATKE